MQRHPKFSLTDELQAEARRQIEDAISRWGKAIESCEFSGFVQRHREETQNAKEEFEQMDAQIREDLQRGTRKTDGFIV